jgi:hypothetical protein
MKEGLLLQLQTMTMLFFLLDRRNFPSHVRNHIANCCNNVVMRASSRVESRGRQICKGPSQFVELVDNRKIFPCSSPCLVLLLRTAARSRTGLPRTLRAFSDALL